MKRRVNLRFLACLLGALAALAAGGYGLHHFQVKHNAGALLQRATREKAEGHPQEALKNYVRYLQLVPGDGDAQADYGLTLDELAKSPRDRERVYFVLERALQLKPDRADARRRLAEVALDIGRYA